MTRERAEAERVLCTRDACLPTYASDSDGDGVSDADELALGTDPHDAASRPYNRDVLDRAARDVLPSLELGESMIVLLPTRDPSGAPLFGGRDAMPGREKLLEHLGITREHLEGLDAARGLSIFRKDKGPRFGVRGLGMSLVAGVGEDEKGSRRRCARRSMPRRIATTASPASSAARARPRSSG